MQNPLTQMQLRLQEIKEELASLKFEGTAGDGAVQIVIRGDMVFESVQIRNDFVSAADLATLEILITEAAQDGIRQILLHVKTKTDALRQEFGLSA